MHINHIKNILTEIEFIKTPLQSNPIHEFEFKGEKYNVTQSLLKSEFQDFLSLETLLENHKNNLYNALSTIVAILAKKDGESLDDYDIESRSELFRQLPIAVAHVYILFFCTTQSCFQQIPQNTNSMESGNSKIVDEYKRYTVHLGTGLAEVRMMR
jgi:hypothetical protein